MSDRIKVRIKKGALIAQDHRVLRWPNLYNETPPVDMIFEAKLQGDYWNCKAHGYGVFTSIGGNGAYGNGSITVFHTDDVIEIKEQKV